MTTGSEHAGGRLGGGVSLRMGPRSLVAGVLAVLLLAGLPPVAARAATGGKLPAADFAFDSNRTGNYEIFVARDDGTAVRELTHDPAYDSWWPRVSPDRSRIIFYRTPAGTHDTDYTKTSLWEMDADGGDVHVLIPNGGYGWEYQGHADWSPDGREIVMFGGTQEIFITNAQGRDPVQVTHRGGTNVDPSWAPDGRHLLFVGCPGPAPSNVRPCPSNRYEVFRIRPDGSDETQLTSNAAIDNDPYYSPDGRLIAWISSPASVAYKLWEMDAGGSDQHEVVGDAEYIDSKPDWRGANLIFFHRMRLDPRYSFGESVHFNIWRVRADGSGLAEVLPDGNYDNEYPD